MKHIPFVVVVVCFFVLEFAANSRIKELLARIAELESRPPRIVEVATVKTSNGATCRIECRQ